MNMFEYYGLFREEHNKDRLTRAETRIIEYLFDKYLPKEGRVLDSAAGEGYFAYRFAENGYVNTKDPKKVELELKKIIAPEKSNDFCHRAVLHGRAVCVARRPQCDKCCMAEFCRFATKK